MVILGFAAASKQRMKPRNISVRKKICDDLSIISWNEVCLKMNYELSVHALFVPSCIFKVKGRNRIFYSNCGIISFVFLLLFNLTQTDPLPSRHAN